MGYSLYPDEHAAEYGVIREAGYSVNAECDWPECDERINRGLAFLCEEHGYFESPDVDKEEPWVSQDGCGLYFCEYHLDRTKQHAGLAPKGEPEPIEHPE